MIIRQTPVSGKATCYTRTTNVQARVWQPIPITILSLPNTCFFVNPGILQDNDPVIFTFNTD
jgi:hypothetical protein